MRVTTVFRRLLGLQAVRVTNVELRGDALVVLVDVELRRRSAVCSRCRRMRRCGTYDSKLRLWRHLDFGAWAVYLRARQRRFHCRGCAAIVTELMPWAEPGSAFTRGFEDLVSFLAQQANQTVVSRLLNIAWPTVGNIVRRTVARYGVPLAARRLVRIGIDEISYRRHHKYLTLVADHDTGQIVWGGEGRSGETLDRFFDALGPEGCASIELVSIDMAQGYIQKVRQRLPKAQLVFDPFHVVKLANDAVDHVRRAQVRALLAQGWNKFAIKYNRWLLLKAPENLRPDERERLSRLTVYNRPLYRAYLLKETIRDLYATRPRDAAKRLDAWLAWARRSRLPPFQKLARTFRKYRDGILAAIEHGLSNGRLEGLNNKIRLLSHRAYGFHSAEALLALVFLTCTRIEPPLPSDERIGRDTTRAALELSH